ncbi:hypothetical protein K493DRAFT_313765 [Basidiobolus meristosporus CBS 931.73]|uniref:Uncharacterized protein n=1 Tax=Basidiobolus meristosporus CBS 931.73 TaxID=1314790 RepID=A0A1Y1YJH5_9FUNG|nr:hypothetical protein K493DRAFT_313765 [Basidiobolus meristosporus CBS 931.73]|eukprot:ORX98145.1 hypothetical protein K493DRAFT_313765 [Basidiobolus meristosporus CBS 931.73]
MRKNVVCEQFAGNAVINCNSTDTLPISWPVGNHIVGYIFVLICAGVYLITLSASLR